MGKTKGFKPMPLSIKIIFILYLLGVIFTLTSIPFAISTGTNFLGFALTGAAGIAIMIFVTVLQLIFVISLWNRYPWAWKYGVAYIAYGIINGLLSLSTVSAKIEESTSQMAYATTVQPIMTAVMYGSIAFSVVMGCIFAYFLYRNKAYFEG